MPQIIHDGEPIIFSLRSYPRAKNIRITIHTDGSVAVSKPKRVSVRDAEKFVTQHAAWIGERVDHFKKAQAHGVPIPSFNDSQEKARTFIIERVNYFSKRYDLYPAAIHIRNQKTRWGSCSPKKTLSFTYKLVFLPRELADYVVVHEICHLAQMNHSTAFWNLVAKEIPKYHDLRKALHAYPFVLSANQAVTDNLLAKSGG